MHRPPTAFRSKLLCLMFLFALGLLSRLPFTSQILYHWDSVKLAYAMGEFDVVAPQPQPPGHIVYVWLCRLVDVLFHGPQRTMVWIAVLSSGLATAAMYLLGRSMFGPRTGLADPRWTEMKEIVNTKIKFREPFRPFAPVVLEEHAEEYDAGLTDAERHYPIRYIQTIRLEWNPLYYGEVERFAKDTGVPVLLNTSFNLRGEPIVNTPQNALNTFGRSEIDTHYIWGTLS